MTTTPILSPNAGGVLIASPSTLFREQVLQSLDDSGRVIQEASGGAEALVKLENGDWQVLFLDRRLPDLDAEELIAIIKKRFPGIEVVLLDSDNGQAVAGFSDYAKPTAVPTGCANLEWNTRGCGPTTAPAPIEPLPGMIGSTKPMLRLYQLVRLVAGRNTTVLVAGPTGTGKELVASALHKLSARASRPFVIVNCAAIPEALLESELFGHVRGAFTGAVQSHLGRIQSASGGTLFLDEIGDLPHSLQAKLLRFLEQREIQRLGSTESMKVDVRVVAATNVELMDKVESGSFREDLYYRLSAFPIELPPLAERLADIVPLAQHFLERCRGPRCNEPVLGTDAVRILEAHAWPGNVRELQHVIERAAILAEGASTIGPEHLYFPFANRCRNESKGPSARSVDWHATAPVRW
ncbi:MAG TPA: sigma-54 dependent transcriptional regulator [Terriglobales bacterium]|jgi:DNA-binding NtrC family response regulator